MLGLLNDCKRFSCEFFSVLNISCLQVYHSALHFTPRQTDLWKLYKAKRLSLGNADNSMAGTWSPCVWIMKNHSGSILSVAFSPNGTQVGSGSSDGTICLWDAVSVLTPFRAILAQFCLLHSHLMAHKLYLGPQTGLFACGMQWVVPISTHSRVILTGFGLLHSHPMAHKLCLDQMTRLFACGMQEVVPISIPSRVILAQFGLLPSHLMAHKLCLDLQTRLFACGMQ